MSTEREVALEQALIAVIGAAERLGVDTNDLVKYAEAFTMDKISYRSIDQSDVYMVFKEIGDAHTKALTRTP